MTTDRPVPLARKFSRLHKTKEEADNQDLLDFYEGRTSIGWESLEQCYRCVILAGAGVGKTHEMKTRATQIRKSSRTSFFIRIEGIHQNFELALEVGNFDEFKHWLASRDEAWFFLDSVDEARLTDPRTFEKAIRCFAHQIRNAQQRAHVVVSSRPYAWRSHSDHAMLCGHLPFPKPKTEPTDDEENALDVFRLDELNEKDIRVFAAHRNVGNADKLINELRRKNLFAIAGRPFDLEGIIDKWKADGQLGSRLDFLRHGIKKHLTEIDPDRSELQSLNQERARKGARSLAAAIVLTDDAGIRVPDEQPVQDGIDAETVLGDWDPTDVHTLLKRGIFNDVIYGKVRFRHRDVRELLAAEWFAHHLENGNSRQTVEGLLFREKYGHCFIAPRLRPLLPWLILFDEDIRRKAVAISPEIVIEGGDISRLPKSERQQLLQDIVERIAGDGGTRRTQEHQAITRIAQADLADDVLRLIDAYRNNDDALIFLCQLVWQGEMRNCLDAMKSVAMDDKRELYTRIAATRAVMSIGTQQQKGELWNAVLAREGTMDRRFLAGIVRHVEPDDASVGRLLASIEKLTPYEQFDSSGLNEALHRFVGRLDPANAHDEATTMKLLNGLNDCLNQPPYLTLTDDLAELSEKFIWLFGVAANTVELLIAARARNAFNAETIGFLQKLPIHEYLPLGIAGLREHVQSLIDRVQEWNELHDALFWADICAERAKGQGVTDGSRVLLPGCCCRFYETDFDRVLTFMDERPYEDDKKVAVWLAYRVINNFGLPEEALDALRAKVQGHTALEQHLKTLTKRSKQQRDFENQQAKHRLKCERKQKVESEHRKRWISELQANPDHIRHPESVKPGEMTNDQVWLMSEIKKNGSSRWTGDDWRGLINEFGQNVAEAYRDAAMAHWRNYVPPLRSKGHTDNSIPRALIFGLAGLEIEASENDSFPDNLSEDEFRLAMRYTLWELNGFPTWLETAYQDRPDIVTESLLAELHWDLDREDAPSSYILRDLVYHAPWLHEHIAGWLIAWLTTKNVRDLETLRQVLFIAKSGNDNDQLTELAKHKASTELALPEKANWFALWVDTNAETGIPELQHWLDSLAQEEASLAAQQFVTGLLGGSNGAHPGTCFGSYRTVDFLKQLYVMMHRHIRVEDDIDRSSGGVYSPELRDDAQDARNALFKFLVELPGKATYVALQELSKNHPDQNTHVWMAARAFDRAEQDGDVEAWSAEQVWEFDESQELTPATHRQLFDLTVDRLIDMRDWLERGDDSPYKTWQRPERETEMRNLVAWWLNDKAMQRYTCAQEAEMASGQRPDIWVQNPTVQKSVPIELKILDNGWTGPGLCERLKNQLAGDYLRAARAGVMLLISQGRDQKPIWKIAGQKVPLEQLEAKLQKYWDSIAHDHPEIDKVKVIVIDLTKRGQRSGT